MEARKTFVTQTGSNKDMLYNKRTVLSVAFMGCVTSYLFMEGKKRYFDMKCF